MLRGRIARAVFCISIHTPHHFGQGDWGTGTKSGGTLYDAEAEERLRDERSLPTWGVFSYFFSSKELCFCSSHSMICKQMLLLQS